MVDQTTSNADGASARIENEMPQDEPGSTRKIHPAAKRNLMIIGGVFGAAVILVVLLIMLRSNKAEEKTNDVNLDVNRAVIDNPNGDNLSPAMRAAIAQKLEEERKAAVESGQKVYIPPETLGSMQPVIDEQAAREQQPVAVGAVQSEPLSPDDVERLARRREGLERQVAQLLATVTPAIAPARITFASLAAAAPKTPAATGAPAGQPGDTTQATGDFLIDSLEIAAGEIASPIDTYKTSYASARIVAGKLAGAFLIGASKQQEDGLALSYSLMRFGGKTYKIDAIGLDEKTSTDAMDVSVDRRYLERWVIPVTVEAAGGFFKAISNPGSSILQTQNNVVVETPASTTEQARNAGFAAGMGILQKEVAREAAKPFRITALANTSIGILFRQPVVRQ